MAGLKKPKGGSPNLQPQKAIASPFAVPAGWLPLAFGVLLSALSRFPPPRLASFLFLFRLPPPLLFSSSFFSFSLTVLLLCATAVAKQHQKPLESNKPAGAATSPTGSAAAASAGAGAGAAQVPAGNNGAVGAGEKTGALAVAALIDELRNTDMGESDCAFGLRADSGDSPAGAGSLCRHSPELLPKVGCDRPCPRARANAR